MIQLKWKYIFIISYHTKAHFPSVKTEFLVGKKRWNLCVRFQQVCYFYIVVFVIRTKQSFYERLTWELFIDVPEYGNFLFEYFNASGSSSQFLNWFDSKWKIRNCKIILIWIFPLCRKFVSSSQILHEVNFFFVFLMLQLNSYDLMTDYDKRAQFNIYSINRFLSDIL